MPPAFPGANLGVKVELLLNSVWVDITAYALQRNPAAISNVGRTDWTSALQASQVTLTLRNDGRFSPKNTAGAYYPNLTRNVQLRVSVNSQSVTGVAYSGYRFWGEVSEWPPAWDPSQRNVWCDITASGIWRRLSQQQTTLGSAYRRYYANLTGGSVPQAYWPMEDGQGAPQLVSYLGASVSNATFTGTPSLAASASFKGSDGVVALNAAVITATVPATGTATNNVTRMLLSVPAAGDSASGTTDWNVLEVDSAGTVAKFEVYVDYTGKLDVNLRNSGGTIIASGTTATNVKGQPVIVSCELTPSGSNVAWAMRIIEPGAGSVTESLTGTISSATIGRVSAIKLNRAAQLMDTAAGHLSATYGAVPSLVTAAYAVNGYVGEYAMDRFTRLCGELGIAAETIGTNTTTAPMGPQLDDTLPNILQTIENTDCGLLFESRGQFGLGYRANASMANQASALTLDYNAAVLDTSLTSAYDDQLTRNNVTVTNWDGYTQQAILTAGPMSTAAPPSGIGNGYAYTQNVCAAADSQCAGIATFLLNAGSVDEIRFPVVTVKLARTQAAALFATLPDLRIGDYFQITNMPSFLTSTTVKQLAWGLSETLNAKEWTISLNTVPETPWETGFSPGTIQTAQIPGASTTFSTAPGVTAPVIANGSITPAMLNAGITIHTLGGNAVTIAASAPATPNVNDIWIASATGLISQWDGSAWQPYKFDASATIQAATITSAQIVAGTIVASNIAAGTITAALLATGIVVAGIVNSTTITGATIIADGSSGELLIYSGSPATGNLIAAISGAAGNDAYSNPYAAGIEVKSGGLVLDNQSSAPSAVSGAGLIYCGGSGRPFFVDSTGKSASLERSTVNVAGFLVGNTTTPSVISAYMTYGASEGTQSSEYEIEIDGIITSATTTTEPLNFQLYVDGAAAGPHITIGGLYFTAGNLTYYYTLRARLAILNTTTAIIGMDGGINKSANTGSETAFPVNASSIQAQDPSVSFDYTLAHTFQMYAWWSVANSGSSGQQLETYRTKLVRRN